MPSRTFSVLAIPTVHLNGTSGKALLEQVLQAEQATVDMLRALHDAAPNARDYYVQGPDAMRQAVKEHESRVERVKSVLTELERIAEGISEQNDMRRGR